MTPPDDDPLSILPRNRQVGCFTGPWNFVGYPALSLPWWQPDAEGRCLPIGVQIVAGFGREDLVLQLANRVSPGAPSRPAAPPAAPPTPRR
jgi:amidase